MSEEREQQFSQFYLACRCGNLDKVEELLSQLSLFALNLFEPNGSTALHAAAYFGHAHIVRVLMAHGGILTILRNHLNLTPAEEANDEIRQLLFSPDVIQLRSESTNTTASSTILFSPVIITDNMPSGSTTTVANETADERPDWIDAYENAHRIGLENHEYMRKWLTKVPLNKILEMITTDYIDKMNNVLTVENLTLIKDYMTMANDEEDLRYLLYVYTTPTSFFKQLNIDLAQRGSDFRFESNISKKYRDDEPPNGFGQYLFATAIMNHPSIEYFRYAGTTYRGMNLSSIELSQYVPDARILTRSFLSTSKRIDTAFLYLQYDNPVLKPVLCVYRVNQSYASLAISGLSAIEGEDEVLIVPFVTFRVVKVDLDSFDVSEKRKVSVVFLDEVTMDDQMLGPSLKSCNNELVDINELQNIEKSIFLVGDPGSGKTTMLRWLLWTNANRFISVLSETSSDKKIRLPILINLNDLVDLNPSASILDFLCQTTTHDDNESAKFIVDYVNFGHALILLDGFDQIQDLQKRKQILMLIHQFAISNSKGNQLIMTSCTLQPILDELFIYYNLELFSFDKVCCFIDNWWNNHCTKISHIQNENGHDK